MRSADFWMQCRRPERAGKQLARPLSPTVLDGRLENSALLQSLKETSLPKRYFLHTTVTADIKRRVKAAAAAEFVTPRHGSGALPFGRCHPSPSPLRAVGRRRGQGTGSAAFTCASVPRILCCSRPVPLHAECGRQRTSAVLVRSHLRSLRPLPKDELLALRCAVSELGALTRELHRIAHVLGQDGQAAAPDQPDLPAVLRLCQALRSETKALIRANVNSWELGRPVRMAEVRHGAQQ